MPSEILKKTSTRYRTVPARGINADGEKPIEREGGDQRAGLIRGMAVVTRGEALGHGHWCDEDFLSQVAAAINASDHGAKARFTHPGLSGDGLGRFLGRAKTATVDEDLVRGDLHFSKSAHKTPDGDLATYTMDLAEEDPAAFGTSICFVRDRQAEMRFLLQHGATFDQWNEFDDSTFESPDPDNTENLPHVRLKELVGIDAVDSPAANPNGLFHRGHELAVEADDLLAYCLGLTKTPPELVQLEVDPDRVSGFVDRFLDRHGLTLVPKNAEEQTVLKDTHPESDQTPDAEEQARGTPPDAVGDDTATDHSAAGVEVETTNEAADAQEQSDASGDPNPGQRFLDAFGEQGGVWFAQGKSFDEARSLYIEQLEAKVTLLETKLQAVDRGAEEPADFQVGDDDGDEISLEARKLSPQLGAERARKAALVGRHRRNNHA